MPAPIAAPAQPEARLVIENQSLIGHLTGYGTVRFRFCPKEAKTYRYTIRGNVPALTGAAGQITVTAPTLAQALTPDPARPNWWTDDPSPALVEGPHRGARTINQWREQFLRDFAARLERCRAPAATHVAP